MIKVVNYGSGNVKAILNIFKRLGIQAGVAEQKEDLLSASKLVLPGVGAFDETMSQLERSGMKELLDQMVLKDSVPVLGICVGMQVMAARSEEGVKRGLGWIAGTVKKLSVKNISFKTKLPHMGWNKVIPLRQHSIFEDVDIERGFYFLHSYFFSCDNHRDVLASSCYGDEFTCAISAGNVFGCQFHPEKSHSNGVNLLRNFARL